MNAVTRPFFIFLHLRGAGGPFSPELSEINRVSYVRESAVKNRRKYQHREELFDASLTRVR